MSSPIPTQTLTQGHLNSFEQCPRRYQYQYLEQLAAPLDPEFQSRTDWGSQFHLLMQQQLLGLTIAPEWGVDPAMLRAVQALLAVVPQLQSQNQSSTQSSREAEHRRVMAWSEQLLLVVVYDLLVIERDRAHILDWKTYPKPPNPQKLAQNWQTLLYPFVLVETSDYEPEQVSMTYWFVQADRAVPSLSSNGQGCEAPHSEAQRSTAQGLTSQHLDSWRLDYTTPQHEQIRTRLQTLLEQLQTLTSAHHEQDNLAFPAVDAQQHHPTCRHCPFQSRCQATAGAIASSMTEQVRELPEIALSST